MRINLNKTIILLSILLSFLEKSNAQISDQSLIKRLSINGFCLCKTTISDLKQSESDLKEVNVEEMDVPPNCFGQDARFIAGKGYCSDKYPGMIFQKDKESDFISKIRLTKSFRGDLPDGNSINMQNFLLKDLFKLYPQFKDQWHSRGCSTYWSFSNDTIEFYVKIDSTKQPQFPIDENYYMNKPIEAIDLVVSCYEYSQNDTSTQEKNSEPLYFIDSVQVTKEKLSEYNPDDIALLTVYKDSATIKKLGLNTTIGAIFIETKTFVKKKNWKYLISESKQYAKLVPTTESDSSIQYIFNGKALNDIPDTVTLSDEIFKGLTIIDKQNLITDYNITGKQYGIVIITKPIKKNKIIVHLK